MTIPFRVKLLTSTAKLPHRNCESDLWDLYADDFCGEYLKDFKCVVVACDGETYERNNSSLIIERPCTCDGENCSIPNENHAVDLSPGDRVLVKTGIAIELPIKYDATERGGEEFWSFDNHSIPMALHGAITIKSYAVADIRPRSGLALKHGITVLNTPGTIDNSYRKEIGVILYNAGHKPYTISKEDKIAQMLIRPLYPSKMEIVENIEDTGRGGYGSTGK